MKQTTLKSPLKIFGKGLHSGKKVSLYLDPAPEKHGVKFYPLKDNQVVDCVPAKVDYVVDTTLCTTISNNPDYRIKTIEHLMAAIFGCGLTNVKIRTEGGEVPAMDGSSLGFFKKILRVGLEIQNAPMRYLKVLQKVFWVDPFNGTKASLLPSDCFEMQYTIDYPEPVGLESKHLLTVNGSVATQLGGSRTFCDKGSIKTLLDNGFGLGGDNKNVVIVDLINHCFENAVRYPDECLRHKLLDAFGDLALAGYPVMGLFVGVKSGHKANVGLIRKLLSNPKTYEIREMNPSIARIMPGAELNYSDLPQFDI